MLLRKSNKSNTEILRIFSAVGVGTAGAVYVRSVDFVETFVRRLCSDRSNGVSSLDLFRLSSANDSDV